MELSIITINYNNLDGLRKTYDSVMSQTFRDFEWIVIDGGSTDGSREFIEGHKEDFAFWCSEPDNGVYHAMNKGIRKATGEYLNFMNSGDTYFDSGSLAIVFSTERTSDILYGAMLLADGTLDHEPMMKTELQWFDFYDNTLPHQASFIKRKLFDKVGFYDETYRISADWHFFAKAFVCYGASLEFIPSVLARFEGGGCSANSKIAEVENARFKQEVFGNYLLANHDRTMYFDVIHQYRILAVLHTLLFRIATFVYGLTHKTPAIEGYSVTKKKVNC